MKYWLLGIHRLIVFIGVTALITILFIVVLRTLAEANWDENSMRIALLLWSYTFMSVYFYGIKFFTKWLFPEKELDARPDKG